MKLFKKWKLVDDWKKFYTWFSIQANAIGSAIAIGYASMYDHLKENFPPRYMAAITAAVFILGIVGRLSKQTPKDAP
jgi:hypothetical protein